MTKNSEVLQENHQLLSQNFCGQKWLLEHLDRYFNQRLQLASIEQKKALAQAQVAIKNEQVLAQKQLESALLDLGKQSLSNANTTLTSSLAKLFVQMILQVRNLLPKEPELLKKLFSIMPMSVLQDWSQFFSKKLFLLKLEQLFEHSCGDTIRCYAFSKTEDDKPLLIHTSVETNAETGLYFISQWGGNEGHFFNQQNHKLFEKW